MNLETLRNKTVNNSNLPKHIAIIMDGNGRWAKERSLPRFAGHREGINSVREITRICGEIGIKTLTLYTFSTENWERPKTEVSAPFRASLRCSHLWPASLARQLPFWSGAQYRWRCRERDWDSRR